MSLANEVDEIMARLDAEEAARSRARKKRKKDAGA